MTGHPRAVLAVLLATTGLRQTDAAALLCVAGRTMRRWMEGVRAPPAVAIDRLAALARALDQAADDTVRMIREATPAAAVLMVYGRDRDVPAWSQWRTKGCHLALARRVVERLPNVHLVAYDRGDYRRWLGSRQDAEEQRTAWAASRVGTSGPRPEGISNQKPSSA